MKVFRYPVVQCFLRAQIATFPKNTDRQQSNYTQEKNAYSSPEEGLNKGDKIAFVCR